jgi:hypothetical protein
MAMMLIHVLEDGRLDRNAALHHHYLDAKGNSKESYELKKLATNNWKTSEFVASSRLEKLIHTIEWRSALRRAGLEGSPAASLTEKTLDQALNGERQVRQKAIRYLESLENDIALIAQTREEGWSEKTKRDWFEALLTFFTPKAHARTHDPEVQANRRSILIDEFGAQGDALAGRNAALDAVTPSLSPPPKGNCQGCRLRPGKQHNLYYARHVGGYVVSSGPPASVTKTVNFYWLLGSFSVFFCGKCKWKYIAKQALILGSFFVLSPLMLWLLWDHLSQWLSLLLVLLVAGGTLGSLAWVLNGPSANLKGRMKSLGGPKHLGLALVLWTEHEYAIWKSSCINHEIESVAPEV